MASDVMCLCVFLLCSGLQFTTGCKGELSYISCSAGESVLLSCRDINSGHTDVQWWICDSQTGSLQYSVFPVDASKGQRYKDRVQIHGNLSLSITRLSVDDAGSYCCKTTETKKMSPVQLTVEGCSISGNEGSVEISRYSGESVFLSCLVKCSARFKPDSEFIWKLPNNREIKQNINPDELHRLYQGRFHMFDRSSGNLSLLVSDLTEKDEGLYSCWSNENQHKNFRLTVKDSAVINALDYQYYLIFLVLLICLMLLLVAGCICWRFTRAKKGSRGSREIQRANDEDEVTYSTVMQIKGRKPAEKQQQNDVTYAAVAVNKRAQSTEDDVTYSSVTHIKGKKRPRKKEEEVVYSTMADMSRST